MRHIRFTTLSSLAALTILPGYAQAQTLIFDNSGGTGSGQSLRVAGSAPIAQLVVGTTTTISNIAVDVDMLAAGNLKYVIFDSASSLLYVSSPKSVGTGRQWAMSDAFSFTLNAGTTYYVGGIADVTAFWGIDSQTASQNGITSAIPNGNAGNYASPVRTSNGVTADSNVRLFSDAPVVMPEPGTLALLGVGLVGLALRRRRVKTA